MHAWEECRGENRVRGAAAAAQENFENFEKAKASSPSWRRSRTVSTMPARLVRFRQFSSGRMRLEVPTLMTCAERERGEEGGSTAERDGAGEPSSAGAARTGTMAHHYGLRLSQPFVRFVYEVFIVIHRGLVGLGHAHAGSKKCIARRVRVSLRAEAALRDALNGY